MTDETRSGPPGDEPGIPSEIPWELLARYVAGESSAREAHDVERWAAADPARARALDELRAIWDSAGVAAGWDVEGILKRSKRQGAGIGLASETQTHEQRRRVRITPREGVAALSPVRRWLVRGVAAAVVLAVGAGVWTIGVHRSALAPERELVTGPGQRIVAQLADGSRVIVGPASRLRYPDIGFGSRGARALTLDGEAVFEVAHDATRPFTVTAGALVTRDVGTRFVVRSYATDAAAEVVVAEGAVAVARGAASGEGAVVVRAGEGVVATASTLRVEREAGVDTAKAFAWAAGRLVFRETAMTDVVSELRRWYGVDVRLGDAVLGDRRLTASFTAEPVASVIASVAAAVGARADRVGGVTVLRVGR